MAEINQQEHLSILMVGAAVDAQTLKILNCVDPLPQIQTYHLQWAMIHGIESAVGRRIHIASTVPVRDFPQSRKIFWSYRRAQRGEAIWWQLPLINLLGFKQLTRFVSSLLATLAWCWRYRRQDRSIVVYGVIVPHLYAALCARYLFKIRLVAILTDPPQPRKYYDESRIYILARWLDRLLLARALRRLDGVVAVTSALAEAWAPRVKSLIVEGVISDEVVKYVVSRATSLVPNQFVVMYAGLLQEEYGTRLLLEAMQLLDEPEIRLWICGAGSMEPAVRRAANADPRIQYFGILLGGEFYPRMIQADVMVNPRLPEHPIARFGFPSKVIECMAMGKLFVSSRLPSIPAEYYDYIIPIEEATPQSLAMAIRRAFGLSRQQREDMGARARNFVWTYKTQEHQGRRIVNFLREIQGGAVGK